MQSTKLLETTPKDRERCREVRQAKGKLPYGARAVCEALYSGLLYLKNAQRLFSLEWALGSGSMVQGQELQ